jgi:hypothetical protein
MPESTEYLYKELKDLKLPSTEKLLLFRQLVRDAQTDKITVSETVGKVNTYLLPITDRMNPDIFCSTLKTTSFAKETRVNLTGEANLLPQITSFNACLSQGCAPYLCIKAKLLLLIGRARKNLNVKQSREKRETRIVMCTVRL